MLAAEARPESLELVDIAARDREPRALPRQRLGDRGSEAARRARHQRGHAGQVEHHAISFATTSISSIVTTLVTLASGAMRLTMAPSTLPPSSTKSSTPAAAIFAMLSRQRTTSVTCSTSWFRMVSGSVAGKAVTLAYRGTAGGFTTT